MITVQPQQLRFRNRKKGKGKRIKMITIKVSLLTLQCKKKNSKKLSKIYAVLSREKNQEAKVPIKVIPQMNSR